MVGGFGELLQALLQGWRALELFQCELKFHGAGARDAVRRQSVGDASILGSGACARKATYRRHDNQWLSQRLDPQWKKRRMGRLPTFGCHSTHPHRFPMK